MNELIIEIAKKSDLAEMYDRYVSYCIKNGDEEIFDFNTVVGKFYELIIKEAAKACLAEGDKWRGEQDITDFKLCTQVIQEHFGVK